MKTYETPELIEFGTVEELTAGAGDRGMADFIAWWFNQEPDPFGGPRPTQSGS